MSIIVKGLKKPKGCFPCWFSYVREKDLALVCAINGANVDEQKPLNCPLVEIPTPHGKLIDERDVLLTNLEILMCEGSYKDALKLICEKLDDAPTILDAEDGELI